MALLRLRARPAEEIAARVRRLPGDVDETLYHLVGLMRAEHHVAWLRGPCDRGAADKMLGWLMLGW